MEKLRFEELYLKLNRRILPHSQKINRANTSHFTRMNNELKKCWEVAIYDKYDYHNPETFIQEILTAGLKASAINYTDYIKCTTKFGLRPLSATAYMRLFDDDSESNDDSEINDDSESNPADNDLFDDDMMEILTENNFHN